MKQTRPSPYPRRSVCAMLVAALCFGTPGQAQGPSTGSGTGVRLPTLGDSVSDDLDVVAERKLGDQVMRQIRPDPDVLDDPLLLGYVQSIWDPLLRAAQQRGDIGADTLRVLAWETFLVRDRSVNAFALPGGFVGVYLGLINITATRDELAAVMAHELAHVTQRHIARAMTSNSRQSLLGMAAMLAAVLAASKSNNASAAQAAVVGGQALLVQGQLNFSRDMEREADRVGFGIFSGAAYAPSGVAAMFEKLESANRLNDSGSFPYLRSHPLTVERIGDARARVEAAKDPRALTPSAEHQLMRARARVLMDPRAESLRRLQASATDMHASTSALDRLANHYASALASMQLREAAPALEAAKAADKALRTLPKPDAAAERAVRLLTAQAMALAGQTPQALALLDAQADGARAAVLTRASLAIDAARAGSPGALQALRPSAEALQAWVTERRDDALAWSLLSSANDAMGLKLRSLRADAESRAALGDVKGAIDRMRAGQRLAREGAPGTNDSIEAAVINARTAELLTLHKELFPDARVRP